MSALRAARIGAMLVAFLRACLIAFFILHGVRVGMRLECAGIVLGVRLG